MYFLLCIFAVIMNQRVVLFCFVCWQSLINFLPLLYTNKIFTLIFVSVYIKRTWNEALRSDMILSAYNLVLFGVTRLLEFCNLKSKHGQKVCSVKSHWLWHFLLLVMESLKPWNQAYYWMLILRYDIKLLVYDIELLNYDIRVFQPWFKITQLRYWHICFDINMLNYDIKLLNFDSTLHNYGIEILTSISTCSSSISKCSMMISKCSFLIQNYSTTYWNTHFDIKLLNYNSNVYMSINNYFNKMSINEKIVRCRLLHTGISPSSSKYLYDMTCLQLWCQPVCV